jgi:hypothetical protein
VQKDKRMASSIFIYHQNGLFESKYGLYCKAMGKLRTTHQVVKKKTILGLIYEGTICPHMAFKGH